MNTVINVHFVVTKLKAADTSKYSCQVVARREYHDTNLQTYTPGILVVDPLNSCVTLFNAQVNLTNNKYGCIDKIEKVGSTKVDNTYWDDTKSTKQRISLLTEMAEVIFSKLVKEEPWDNATWTRKARTKTVEPLFTIPLARLDEMISKDLTVTYG